MGCASVCACVPAFAWEEDDDQEGPDDNYLHVSCTLFVVCTQNAKGDAGLRTVALLKLLLRETIISLWVESGPYCYVHYYTYIHTASTIHALALSSMKLC